MIKSRLTPIVTASVRDVACSFKIIELTWNFGKGVAGALVDAVILQPKIGGIGFDLKKLFTGVKET